MLVGHEVWFDLAFLEPEMRRLGGCPLAETFGILDTHLLARVVHEGAPADLDALARRLGVTIPARHSASGTRSAPRRSWCGSCPCSSAAG